MQSDPAHDELVEKMARAIADQLGDDWDDNVHTFCGDDWRLTPDGAKEACCAIARAALAVARPFIRAEALEEAAKVVGAMPRTHTKIKEDHDVLGMTGTWTFTLNNGPAECAAAIRAMMEKNDE
jgi:hypothetical protein